MLNRIEPDGLLDVGNGREGLAAKDIDDAELVVRVSVVWIEIHPRGRLGGGSVEILFPQEDNRGVTMHEGDLRALLQGQADILLGIFERPAPVVRPMVLPVQNMSHRDARVRLAVVRVLGDRLRKKVGRPIEHLAVPCRPHHQLTASQEKVVRLAAGRFDGAEHCGFDRAQFDLQGVYDSQGDLVLDRKDVAELAIEAVGPKVSARFGVD
jgi:hypothetical protein